jgi:hypothetical protein
MAKVTYLGPADEFRVSEDAKPIGKGDEVTLTEAQLRILVRNGHRFDTSDKGAAAVIDEAQALVEAERDAKARAAAAKK